MFSKVRRNTDVNNGVSIGKIFQWNLLWILIIFKSKVDFNLNLFRVLCLCYILRRPFRAVVQKLWRESKCTANCMSWQPHRIPKGWTKKYSYWFINAQGLEITLRIFGLSKMPICAFVFCNISTISNYGDRAQFRAQRFYNFYHSKSSMWDTYSCYDIVSHRQRSTLGTKFLSLVPSGRFPQIWAMHNAWSEIDIYRAVSTYNLCVIHAFRCLYLTIRTTARPIYVSLN